MLSPRRRILTAVLLSTTAVFAVACVEQSRKSTGFMQPNPGGPKHTKVQTTHPTEFKPATPEQVK